MELKYYRVLGIPFRCFWREGHLVPGPKSVTEPVKNLAFAVADAVQQQRAYPPAAAAAAAADAAGEIEDRWLTRRRRRKAAVLRVRGRRTAVGDQLHGAATGATPRRCREEAVG